MTQVAQQKNQDIHDESEPDLDIFHGLIKWNEIKDFTYFNFSEIFTIKQ